MAQEQETIKRNLWLAVWCGFRTCCPACSKGRIYSSYLKVADHCPICAEDLSQQKADDAPAYFTILIVGHIIIPLMLLCEIYVAPPIALQLAVWLPLIAGLSLVLLPRVKGVFIGLQWAMFMDGFSET